jgi:hypothetical protein
LIEQQITRARHASRVAELVAMSGGEHPTTCRQRSYAAGAEQALMWVTGAAWTVLPGDACVRPDSAGIRSVEAIRAVQARTEAESTRERDGAETSSQFWERLGWSQGASSALLWVLDEDGWTVPAPMYLMELRPTRQQLAQLLAGRINSELALAGRSDPRAAAAANALDNAGDVFQEILRSIADSLADTGIFKDPALGGGKVKAEHRGRDERPRGSARLEMPSAYRPEELL